MQPREYHVAEATRMLNRSEEVGREDAALYVSAALVHAVLSLATAYELRHVPDPPEAHTP